MLRRISENCWFMEHEPASDRCALGYIRGSRYAFAADAGASKAHVDKFYAELEKAGLRKPDFTGISHYHWDHSYGAWAVNGVTIASDLCNRHLKQEARFTWDEQSMLERVESGTDIKFCYVTRKVEYPDTALIKVVPADIEITSDCEIDLGGTHVRLIYCGGPHSRDSVMFLCPEDRVLFLGDACSKDFFENKWDYDENDPDSFDRAMGALPHDLKRLAPFVRRLKEIDFEKAVFGHASEPTDRKELIEFLEGFL